MSRRLSWWLMLVVVVLGIAFVRGGGACGGGCRATPPEPDERLAGHFRRLCDVAEEGIRAPDAGVRKLMRYHGDHGPDMLEAFGATLVRIERIDDDAAHDRRARVARDRIYAPVIQCQQTWEKFAQAVERDPVAHERLDRALERLSRTLEIIFGNSRSAMRDWPEQVRRALDERLP